MKHQPKKQNGKPSKEPEKRLPKPIPQDERKEDQIEGRNAVLEALKSGQEINKLYVAKGEISGSLKQILAIAKERSILIKEADRSALDAMSQSRAHQGVIATISPVHYVSVDDILAKARNKGEAPFVILLDEICDPNNLGSILRTADAVGAHGIILPKHRSISVTATVAKVAAGAVAYVPIARVSNLSTTIDYLKEQGLWIAGTDLQGAVPFYQSNLKGALGIVIGSEGKGMSRLVTQKCDFIINIPMSGEISSLNAGVAAGIILYEAYRQRNL